MAPHHSQPTTPMYVVCVIDIAETGLFVNMEATAYFGAPDGSVSKEEI